MSKIGFLNIFFCYVKLFRYDKRNYLNFIKIIIIKEFGKSFEILEPLFSFEFRFKRNEKIGLNSLT